MPEHISKRRSLAKILLAGAGAAALPASAAHAVAEKSGSRKTRLVKPARLREGDLVGLITPSGHADAAQIAKAINNMSSLGLRVKLGQFVHEARGNYAGKVYQRLEDLHAMFTDNEVKGIWCITGGSGAISLLPYIDYALIARHPKVFVGYSDTTALHLAIHQKTGLVTFHAPLAVSTFGEYSMEHLRAVLMAPQSNHVMTMAEENRQRGADTPSYVTRTLRPGVSTGRLYGGNLSMVAALAGTPYFDADFHQKLLFLEDINEPPYKIDRMMTQLNLSGNFNHSAGIMLGIFEKCEAKDNEKSLSLAETLGDHFYGLTVPSATGFSFGHIKHQMTLPLGILARMDTEGQTLILLEAAVS